MNKSRETHSPSEDDGPRHVQADPWAEFLSETSDELQHTLKEPEEAAAPGPVASEPSSVPRLDERLDALASRHVGTIEEEFAVEAPAAAGSLPPLPSWMIGEAARRESQPDTAVRDSQPPTPSSSASFDGDRSGTLASMSFEVEEPQAPPVIAEPLPPPVPFATTPTITLASIVARQVPVHWSEAVATVQQLCDVLSEREPAAGVPELGDVSITDAGDVIVHERGPSPPDVRNLALALHALLATATTPLPLRLFVTSSTSTQRYSSIQAYADALSLYAATAADRSRLIQALCLRSLEFTPTATTHLVRVDDEPRASRAKRRFPVAAASLAAVVTVACGAGATYWLQHRAPAQRAALSTQPIAVGTTATDPAAPAARPPADTRGTRRSPGLRAAAAPEAATLGGPAPPLVPVTASTIDSTPTPALSDAASTSIFEPPASPPVTHAAPAPHSANAGNVERPSATAATLPPASALPVEPAAYTRADNDVRPPVIRSSLMPPTPAGLGVDRVSSTLELLVDPSGNVQRAHFIGPTRMIDTGALSAAKMLKFTPATKDGKPVWYLLHLPWTSSPY